MLSNQATENLNTQQNPLTIAVNGTGYVGLSMAILLSQPGILSLEVK